MNKIIRIFLVILMLSGAAFANAQKQVAVYVTGDQDDAVKKVLGSKMVSFITKAEGFKAVERTADFLAEIQSEHDYQLSGEVSNEQIKRLGNKYGAQYVAVIDAAELFGEFFVSSRLIDVQTGAIESSYEASGEANNMQALSKLASDVADGLILEPQRKIAEKERAERQRKEAEEQERINRIRAEENNRRAQLRNQAINNLMPAEGININNQFILINRAIPLRCYINSENEVKFDYNIPQGYKIADFNFLDRWCRYFPEGFYLSSNMQPTPVKEAHVEGKWISFKYKTNEGCWHVWGCYAHYSNHSSFDTFRYEGNIITKKEKGQLTIIKQRDFYIAIYRDFFSESEIQAEMNRISKGY